MNIQYIAALALISITLVSGDLGVTYKYDNFRYQTCDDCAQYVSFRYRYKIFGRERSYAYISSNGFLTFNGNYGWKNPTSVFSWFRGPVVVAPLWSDIYLPNQIDTSHLIYTETQDWTIRNDARQVIRDNFAGCGEFFEPTSLFIVTWEEQSSYCDRVSPNWPYIINRGRRDMADEDLDVDESNEEKRDEDGIEDPGEELSIDEREDDEVDLEEEDGDGEEDPGKVKLGEDSSPKSNRPPEKLRRNTFQVALVTDGCDTYAIINIYKIKWKKKSCPTRYRMLFNDGAWWNGNFYSNPSGDYAGSSNVGIPGRWVYKVDDPMIRGPGCDTLGTHGGTPSVG